MPRLHTTTLLAVFIAQIANAQSQEKIQVEGARLDDSSEKSKSYKVDRSENATKLDISIQETPQTLNVVTRQQMQDFGLTNAREALANTPGVVVQNQETDRTSYGSRGSEISNFQVDGLGFPFDDYNYQGGDVDTFIYDRVEVIKGANGLTSSLGDPGASVNFVRKRPTRALQTGLGLSLGSWNTKRIEGDVAGPITDGFRGRLVAAAQDGESYLDNYKLKKNIVSGMIEADITSSTKVTLGFFQQNSTPRGNNWGALPLLDVNGNQLSYERNHNPVPDWAKWDRTAQNGFIELQHDITNNLKLKVTYQGAKATEDAALVYYDGAPDENGQGLTTYIGLYDVEENTQFVDANLSGRFPAIGRDHEFVIGANQSKHQYTARSWSPVSKPTYNWYTWDGQFDKPEFTPNDPSAAGADYDETIRSAYAATRLHLTEELKWLIGANSIQAKGHGNSYGTDQDSNRSKTLPYTGITYNITPGYTAYASYTTIFRPQVGKDADGNALKPVEGLAYELGVKGSWMDDALMGSIALFKTEQNDYPLRPSDSASIIKEYEVGDLRTEGFEINLNGKITAQTNIMAGYTQVKMKDDTTGKATRTYLPPRLFNLLVTQEWIPGFRTGAGLTWFDKVHQDFEGSNYDADGNAIADWAGTIRQGDYTLLDLMASYDVTPQFSVQLNGRNVGDKKYLNSFPDGQGFYGAPANYSVAINYRN